MKKIALTGIKPTGVPHFGNYLGAIAPALKLVEQYDARYFIADYHALNMIKDPKILKQYIYEVAATWIACGLDPNQVLFYKQSSIPELFELTTILMAFTSKGLMNRAHSYKAKVAENVKKNKDTDFRVNMGLFTYPVLMASDILLFDTDVVPVGKDQIQHIEMAIDIAQTLNHNYKKKLLNIPTPMIDNETKTIIGLDGRKMSKSYGNTIPLFCNEKKLKKLIMKIITDSKGVEDVKDPNNCSVFNLYKNFASQNQQNELKEKYISGKIGYGEAKKQLFEVVNEFISPMREKYNQIINDKGSIDSLLKIGGEKSREIASKKMSVLRKTIGIC